MRHQCLELSELCQKLRSISCIVDSGDILGTHEHHLEYRLPLPFHR